MREIRKRTSNNFDQGSTSFRMIHAEVSVSDTYLSSIQSMQGASTQIRRNSEFPGDTSLQHVPDVSPIVSKPLEYCNDMFVESVLHGHKSHKLGNFNEALTHFQRAISLKTNSIHFETVAVQVEYANVLFNTGLIYMTQYKNYAISSEAFEQCLEVRKRCLGSIHLDVLDTMYCLAHANLTSGDDCFYAFTLLNESLSILITEYPSNLNGITTVWHELSCAQFANGDIDDAESSLSEIRKMKDNRPGLVNHRSLA